MASAYSLPHGTPGNHHGHTHSHSHNPTTKHTASHDHGHSHSHSHDHPHGHSHNHSCTSTGDPFKESPFKNASLQETPLRDPFTPNRAILFPYVHSPSEEQDEFNPNGLQHSGHMRTHSFVKSGSPFRATHARSGSILDVPLSPLRETHAHVTATTGVSRYGNHERINTQDGRLTWKSLVRGSLFLKPSPGS